MKKKLFTAVIIASLVFLAFSPAQALEVKLSGQINRAILWADDGNDSELFHVDNDNSSTRFRLTGSEQVTDMVKVGVVWENEFQSNASNNVTIGQKSDDGSSFNDRKLEAYFEMPFGTIWIGQGDGAANGTSEVDLSGTSVIMYSGVNDTGGSIIFRNGSNVAIDPIDATRTNFDGLSRNDRLRYDTPKFGGFYFSGSITNGDAYELAGRWAAEFDGIGKFSAAIGYVDTDERANPQFKQVGMSGSWLHTSGLNVTLALGNRDVDGGSGDPSNYYLKVGYKFGIHALAAEYGMTKDLAQDGDESSNYGVAYVASPWSGVEFYGTIRVYKLERDGVSGIEDISQFMFGTRVKF